MNQADISSWATGMLKKDWWMMLYWNTGKPPDFIRKTLETSPEKT
jgi:hypothetical protein